MGYILFWDKLKKKKGCNMKWDKGNNFYIGTNGITFIQLNK